jgi:hypothetical protein
MLAASALVAALLLVGTAESAQAQIFPRGDWSGPSPWQQAPRRQRRPRQFVEPTDEKPATPLPAPNGPLLIVVSIEKQHVTVYEGTTQIVQSPISSGMSSKPTPTGIFSILEKNRYHYSNLYGAAPMPFMQRITNSGVAMHAGELPGYPASHGCIRLPYSFARNLFGITGVGARVIVSDEDLTPAEFHSTRLIAPLPPDDLAQANPAGGATAETAANVGVTQVAAEMAEKPRTRAMAAAARAAERERFAANITSAEAAKTAAIAHVKAMTDAARAAKEEIRKARNEAGRFADAARRASRAADKAEEQFAELTGKMSKIEAGKLMRIEIDKIAAEEMLEERKVVELAALARAAKALADKQAHAAKRTVARAEEAEKTRRAALDGVKKAEQAITDAKATLAGAEVIEARKDLPVSIFVNAKTGRLIAKLGFVPVIDVPVTISEPSAPLGTHVFTATALTDRERSMRWTVVSLKSDQTSRAPPRKRRPHADEVYVAPAGADADAARALDRIEIPKETVERLAELMKPGSSLIVSDYPLSRETSNRTEFIIEPWRSRRHVEQQEYKYE